MNETVDAYDFDLTKRSVASLNKGRTDLAAAAVGDYALFGGGSSRYYHSDDGYWISTASDVVDVYHYV